MNEQRVEILNVSAETSANPAKEWIDFIEKLRGFDTTGAALKKIENAPTKEFFGYEIFFEEDLNEFAAKASFNFLPDDICVAKVHDQIYERRTPQLDLVVSKVVGAYEDRRIGFDFNVTWAEAYIIMRQMLLALDSDNTVFPQLPTSKD